MKIYLEPIVRVYKEKSYSKDSLATPNVGKEWFIRNTDGHIVLATWAEMFDNSLDKGEKEED